jgi:SAM-dependent methyltransferase
MVEVARTLNAGIEFRVGDLRRLPVDDSTLAGIVCFYSLIHLESGQLAPALARLRRSLRSSGQLLLGLHEGREAREPGELWGIPVALRFTFFTYEDLKAALPEAGFTIEQITHRPLIPMSRWKPTAFTPPPSSTTWRFRKAKGLERVLGDHSR